MSVYVSDPQFKGQTKQELGTPAVQTLVYDVVKAGLSDWMDGGGKKTQITAQPKRACFWVVAAMAQPQVRITAGTRMNTEGQRTRVSTPFRCAENARVPSQK